MVPVLEAVHTRPFPGMRAFEEEESELFFGQEEQISSLIDRLGRIRFVAVMGDSGCGKSSLVKAGLIPSLRGSRKGPASELWHIVTSRPGHSPLSNLADEIAQSGLTGLPPAEVERDFRASSLSLVDLIWKANLSTGHRVLIVIDQFEELFRFQKDSESAFAKEDAALFVKLLLAVKDARQTAVMDIRGPDALPTPIYVVLTMRSEYLGDAALFFELAEAMNEGAYLLPKMKRRQIESAVVGPLRMLGATIEPGLLQRLVKETELAQEDGLPMLQHALRCLWDKADKATYPHLMFGDIAPEEASQIQGLLLEWHLNRTLDAILDSLGPRKSKAEQIFKQLGEYDNKGRLVRRSCAIRELTEACGLDIDEVMDMADRFRDEEKGHTFLRPPRDKNQALLDGTDFLDISHEALLRRWNTLRDWIKKEAEDAAIFKRLAGLANAPGGPLLGAELLPYFMDWFQKFSPTETWAKRYGSPEDWRAARNYLERSRHRARLQRGGYVGLWLLLSLVIVGWLLRSKQHALETQAQEIHIQAAEEQKQKLQKALDAETTAKQEAVAAKKTAEEEEEKANQAEEQEKAAKNEALREAQKAQTAEQQEEAAKNVAVREAQKAQTAEKEAEKEAAKARIAEQNAKDALAERDRLAQQNADFIDARDRAFRLEEDGSGKNLRKAIDVVRSFIVSGDKAAADSASLLANTFALTRLQGTDTKSTSPVILALANPGSPSNPKVFRQGDLDQDRGDTNKWVVVPSASSGEDLIQGEASGYVVSKRGDSKPQAKRLHAFAVTGVGISTDGKWVASASSSGDIRVTPASQLKASPLKDKLTNLLNNIKLVPVFLAPGLSGVYPVRQFAISTCRNGIEIPCPEKPERGDLSVAALTEDGRLIWWEHPGRIGKLLPFKTNLEIPHGITITAIATNPKTQQIWTVDASGTLSTISGHNLQSRCTDQSSSVLGGPTSVLAWDDSGTRLATGGRDGWLHIYEYESKDKKCGLTPLISFRSHSAAISSIVWQGDSLVSGSVDGSARSWNLKLDEAEKALFKGFRYLPEETRFADLSKTELKNILDTLDKYATKLKER